MLALPAARAESRAAYTLVRAAPLTMIDSQEQGEGGEARAAEGRSGRAGGKGHSSRAMRCVLTRATTSSSQAAHLRGSEKALRRFLCHPAAPVFGAQQRQRHARLLAEGRAESAQEGGGEANGRASSSLRCGLLRRADCMRVTEEAGEVEGRHHQLAAAHHVLHRLDVHWVQREEERRGRARTPAAASPAKGSIDEGRHHSCHEGVQPSVEEVEAERRVPVALPLEHAAQPKGERHQRAKGFVRARRGHLLAPEVESHRCVQRHVSIHDWVALNSGRVVVEEGAVEPARSREAEEGDGGRKGGGFHGEDR